MNVSQAKGGASVKNIEVSSLLMLFSKVENTASEQMQLLQPQQEYYKEISQDAA